MKHNYSSFHSLKSFLTIITLCVVCLNSYSVTKRLVAGTHFDPKDPTVQYFPVIDEDGNNDSKLFFFGNPEKQHFRATSQYPSYGGHDHRWLRYSTSPVLENNKYVCSKTDRITGGKDGDGYTFSKVNRDGFFFISKPGYNEYSVLGEFDMVGLAPGTVYDIEIGWYNISDTYWSGNDGARILVEVYSNGTFVKRFTWNDYVYANSGLQTSTATVTVPAGKNSLEVFIFNNYSKYRSMIAVDYILVYGQGLYITPDSEGPYPAGEEVVLTANDGTAPYKWYKSTDGGVTYTQITGETSASITVAPEVETTYKCVDAGLAEDTYTINPTVICDATKTKSLFAETFGTLSSETARASTTYCPYTYIESCKPIKNGGEYAIVAIPKWGGCGTQASGENSCNCTSDFWFNDKYDHTQGGLKGGKYGGMLMLNCNNIGDVLYERTVDVCSQTYLLFSVWVTAANKSDVDPIKAKFVLRGGSKTGPVIDEYEVKNIDVNTGWKQISAMFNSGTYSQVTIQLVNLAPAGQRGNDLLVDDIEFKACNPESYLYVDDISQRTDTVLLCPYDNGSQKESVTLKTVINGTAFSNPYYYWQKSNDGTTWEATPITGSGQGDSYKNLTVTSGDCGYYRVIIATSQADAQAIAEDPESKKGCGLYSISNASHIECRDIEVKVSTPVMCIGSDKAKYTVSVVNTLPYIVSAKTVVSCRLGEAAGYTNSRIENLTSSLSSINTIKYSEIEWDVEIATLPAYKKGVAVQDTIKFVYYATPTTTATEVASWFFIAEAKGLTNPNQTSCPEKSKFLVNDGVAQTCDDITLSVSQNKTSVCLGDSIVYTIKAKNNQNVTSDAVNIKVTIPANQQYVSCTGGTYDESTAIIAVGTIAANAEKTITLTTKSKSVGTSKLSISLTNDDTSTKQSADITVNALPTASITGDAAVCLNGSLTLTGSGGTQYKWGTEAYSTTNTYDVVTTSAGAQTIKLKVKDANGCESTEDSKSVTVNALPSITSVTQGQRCGAGTVTMSATASDGASVKWYAAQTGGTALGTGGSYTTSSISATTTYYVEAEDNTTSCVSSGRTTIDAIINAVPTITTKTAASCSSDLTTYSLTVTVSEGTVTCDKTATITHTGNDWTISGVAAGTNCTLTVTSAISSCTNTLDVTAPDCDCPTIEAPTGAHSDSYCAGSSKKAISVNEAATGYRIDWYDASTGGNLVNTGASFTPTAAGTYYAEMVQIVSGCKSSTRTAATLTENALPTISYKVYKGSTEEEMLSPYTITCTDQSARVVLSGGATYKWSDSDTSGERTFTEATNLTVKSVSAEGCESSNSETIEITKNTSTPNVSVTPTSGTIDCATTSITLTASSTTAGVTYKWNDASSTTGSTLTVSDAGTYTVTATATNGCTNTASATITKDVELPNVSVTPTSGTIDCSITSITLTASSTTAGVTYKWNDASSTTGSTLTVSDAGTYTVTATATNGCTNTASATITKDVELPNVSVTPTSGTIDCTTTSITLTASSTTEGVTYKWNDASSTTGTTLTVSDAGTYTVTATATNGCTNTAGSTITKNVDKPNVSVTPTSGTIDCATTSITLTASSTTEGVTYKWNDASSTTGSTLTVSDAGTYTVTATATNGCTNTASATITKDVELPNVSVTPTSGTIDCATTSITLTASSTTAGVTYKWNDASSTTGTTLTVSDAGTYTVTATATNGCTNTASATITKDVELPNVSVTPTSGTIDCSTTSITLTASSTTAGVTYKWDDASSTTGSTLTVSDAGTYTVTATATNGCTNTASATITKDVELPNVSVTPTSGTIDCTTTSITLTASSTTAGVTYKWNDASSTTGSTLTVSDAGTYTVTATATNGCTNTASATITKDVELPNVSVTPTSGTIDCSTTSITLTASSTTEGVTYKWDDASSTTGSTLTVSDAGTYTVTATATNGCTNTASATITKDVELPNVSVTPTSGTIDCSTTSITLTASSTTAGVTYKWNDASSTTGETLTVSDAGTYTVTATATNGCTNTASATITKDVEKPAAPISLGDKEYCDQSTIETLAVQAPVDAKYEIKWYDNSITYLASGATYTPATEPAVGGTDTYYAETYNTENHCASEEKTALTITRNALPTPTATNNTPICSGETVELSVDAYTSYIWSGPQSFTSTEQEPKIENATVDATGDYTVEVTDANGCKNTSTTTVTVNPTPELTYTAFDPLTGLEVSEPYKLDCNVPSIRVELSGGSTYQWSDGKTEQSRTIENAGTYSVYPISDKGCIGEEKTISVTSNKNKPVLKLSSKDAEGNDNTLLTCTVEELTLDVEVLNPDVATDVTYEWTFTDGSSTDKSIVVIKPDTYKMVAQAANGCYSDENQIVITQDIRVPVVTVDAPSDILTCVTEFITLEAKADIEGCSFEWNDGSTESTLKVDAEGLYSVKATATNGCVSLPAEKEITDKTQIPVIEITPSAEKVTCENVILTASSESEGMTYVWSDEFATTGATLEVSKKGTYTVTGTNIYSCVGEASFDIDEDKSAPVISITPNKGTLTCEITSIDVEATETSGIASVSYKWSNGKTTAKNNFTEKGTYTVTATNDATTCKSEKSVTINENKQYPIVALQALEAVCLPATVDISKAVVVSESKFDDIKYYYDAAGTQPLDNPVVDVVTKQIFYVQGFGVEGSGCVGQQIYPIEVMLKDVTSTPVVNNYDECPAAMSKSLKEQVVSDRSNLTFYDMPEGGAPRSDMFDASKENTDAVYYVTNTESGKCESERAEIDVHIDGTIDIEVTADDDEVYAGQQEVTVSAKSIKESQVNNYKWQKNALVLPETGNEVTTLLYSNTKFTVTGEGRCNSVSKEITIRALWPTLITPKTGANGHFAKGCDITVFNRFNEKVFQGNDGWDGTLDCNLAPKGEIASPGVYYYYINIPDGGTHRGTIEVVKF